MKLLDTVGIALNAIRANALRSILTTLGIIIGVSSVIIMVAIGAGARQAVEERIAQLGTNMLTIIPGSSRTGGRFGGAGTAQKFTDADGVAVRALPDVQAVSGSLSAPGAIVFENRNWTTGITGVGASYPEVRDWDVLEGSFFTPEDVRAGRRLAVLGTTVAAHLFDGASPLGARIRIANVPFEVIGVMQDRGESGFGRDQDDIVLAPITAVRARITGQDAAVPNQVDLLFVKVTRAEAIDAVTVEITELLRERRRIRADQDNDFRVRNLADLIRARTETFATLTFLLGATGAVSLLVGGIGIMNIMLVSVPERTREIGLRMAVGARRGAILMQFLTEAVTLCLIGGFIGIVIGVSGTVIISYFGGWPAVIDASLIALAIAASAGVGIVFGYFPARRASLLNPIDALRYE